MTNYEATKRANTKILYKQVRKYFISKYLQATSNLTTLALLLNVKWTNWTEIRLFTLTVFVSGCIKAL